MQNEIIIHIAGLSIHIETLQRFWEMRSRWSKFSKNLTPQESL